jgi:biotin operon repressor
MAQGIEHTAWELLDELGISRTHLKELVEHLESEFSAAEGG